MTLAPVLVFVYNRLDHTKNLITSLQNNKLSEESEVIIYSDHPINNTQEEAVKQVRKYIHSVTGFKSLTIIEREKNYGLAANIIDGVTHYVETYGKVIVLEDDLVVAPYFLKFMNDGLEVYKDEYKVGHIHGCNFFDDQYMSDTFLVKWTGSWGWATWERAWKEFNPDGKALLEELKKKKLTYTFDFNGAYGFTRMLYRQTIGKNNSWAIRWNASLFLKDLLSLNPGKSLVQNMGFDGSGTHCGGGGLYATSLFQEEIAVIKIDPIEESMADRAIIEKYYKKTNSFKAKAIRRIKRTLKGDFKP